MRNLLIILGICILTSIDLSAQYKPVDIDIPSTGGYINAGIYLNRNGGFLRMINGTNLNGQFQPRISGNANSSISPGLTLVGTPSSNNSSTRGILLRAGEYNLLNQGNILEISNYTTPRIVVDVDGYLGLNTTDPQARIHVQEGDVYLEDLTSGVIMRSPDGTCWRYQPDNSGALVGTAITCP